MKIQRTTTDEFFDESNASRHDRRLQKLSPMRDSLHLLARMILADLPGNANVLCVGVGTGIEVIELAKANPSWQFVLVEPSQSMLEICRKKMEIEGVISRCQFHHGYLSSLSNYTPFDAVTSFLVSQFIFRDDERKEYFSQIFHRLKNGGILLNADLSSGYYEQPEKALLDVWFRTMKYADVPKAEIENFGVNVVVSSASDVEMFIQAGGFSKPVLFYQNLFIYAWFAIKNV